MLYLYRVAMNVVVTIVRKYLSDRHQTKYVQYAETESEKLLEYIHDNVNIIKILKEL